MEVVMEQDWFTVLPTILIPTVVVLAPFVYMLLSNRQKPSRPKDSPDRNAAATDPSTTDYSKFDTSNLRVTKILIHPIKSCKGTSVQEAKYTLEGLEVRFENSQPGPGHAIYSTTIIRMIESGASSGQTTMLL
jgi:hypothetical protein